MFHMFRTYVAEILSCCNISMRRKQTHTDAVPAGIAVPTCEASEAGVWSINKHVARSPLLCPSTGMWHSTASVCAHRAGAAVACGMRWLACRHNRQASFHFFMSGAHSHRSWGMRRKIVTTPSIACSRERTLLAHARLQGVQVGACWDGYAGGGEAQQSGWTTRQDRHERPDVRALATSLKVRHNYIYT
jgi:hypothetical protein